MQSQRGEVERIADSNGRRERRVAIRRDRHVRDEERMHNNSPVLRDQLEVIDCDPTPLL
jgi:hypothetical protein